MTSWWKTLFADTDAYLEVHQAPLSKSLKVEIPFLLKHLQKGTVLDVPSGYGRIALPLAEEGFTVHCVDFQKGFIDLVPEHPRITKEVADMRTYRKGEYDNVISMFFSFGYFGEEEDRQTLQNMVRSCKKSGVIILDVKNPHTHHNAEEHGRSGTYKINSYFPEWYEETLKISEIYGDYKGGDFTKESPRMILKLIK